MVEQVPSLVCDFWSYFCQICLLWERGFGRPIYWETKWLFLYSNFWETRTSVGTSELICPGCEERRGLFFWAISFFFVPALLASFCMVGDGSVVACIIDLLLFANDWRESFQGVQHAAAFRSNVYKQVSAKRRFFSIANCAVEWVYVLPQLNGVA